MLQSLKSLFTPDPIRQQAHDAYLRIVAQARNPVFYTGWHAPDTLDGRFDVIVLHVFLIWSRCEEKPAFCRALTELFFADMDRSLREMGASDTGVGKRVKAMAQAFYGRLKAYKYAMEDEAALAEALRRNVWRQRPVSSEAVSSLAAYMRRNREALRAQPVDDIVHGQILFS